MSMYIPIIAKQALNDTKSTRLPYHWDLNIYRGCEHRCVYCYALYSQKYLEDEGNFFKNIYYKENIVECLEKKLKSKTWKREPIGIGTVCDSYQPLEKEKQFMPQILRLLIKYKTPCVISTKSELILRDIDLINELSQITYVGIALTITTTDEKLAKKIEPNVVSPQRRFEVIKELREKTNAHIGVHSMPIIPYLTDSYQNIDSLVKSAKEYKADYIMIGGLNLYSETKKFFLNFMQRIYSDIYPDIKELYSKSKELQKYRQNLREMTRQIRKRNNFWGSYKESIPNTQDNEQLSFFD